MKTSVEALSRMRFRAAMVHFAYHRKLLSIAPVFRGPGPCLFCEGCRVQQSSRDVRGELADASDVDRSVLMRVEIAKQTVALGEATKTDDVGHLAPCSDRGHERARDVKAVLFEEVEPHGTHERHILGNSYQRNTVGLVDDEVRSFGQCWRRSRR